MAKFGTFKFGQAKFGTKPITPWDPDMTYKGLPAGTRIHGQVNKEFIYRVSEGHQFKYAYFVPTNPQTEIQQSWRATFTAGMAAASALTPEEREPYKERAREKGNLHWHNVFMSDYLWSASH